MQFNIFLTLFAIASTAVAHPHGHAHLHALRAATPEAAPEAVPEPIAEAAPSDAVPAPSEEVKKRDDGSSDDEKMAVTVELLSKPAAGIVVAPLKKAKGTDKKKQDTKTDKKTDTSNKAKDDKKNTSNEQNIQDTTKPKPSAKIPQINCCCCDPAVNKVVCKKIPSTQECFCLTAMCGGGFS